MQIKFIAVNYCKWIKNEKRLFLILLINLSLLSAVIIYLFSFNNQLLYSGIQEVYKATYGRTYSINGKLDNEVYIFIDSLLDNDNERQLELLYISGMTDINDKNAKVASVYFANEELNGYYYDAKYDVNKSGEIAIATDDEINIDYGLRLSSDLDSVMVSGSEYKVKYSTRQFSDGMETMLGGVLGRLQYEDFKKVVDNINEIKIIFKERLTDKQEADLYDKIQKYGIVANLDRQPEETSGEKNYRVEMIIDSILLLASASCVMKIYDYILNTRKDEFVIYRICGSGKNYVSKVLTVEISITTLIGFFIGSTVFMMVWNIATVDSKAYFDMMTWLKAAAIMQISVLVISLKMITTLRNSSLIQIRKGN